jgi:hypothetical protein
VNCQDVAYWSGPSRHTVLRRLSVVSARSGRDWTCSLPGPVATDKRQSQDSTVKKGLHRLRLSAIILSSRPRLSS